MKDINLKPIITEKSMSVTASGKYTFLVKKEANKNEIRKAVEDLFKVNVVSITTVVRKGKTRRIGKKRIEKLLASRKKAVVKLKDGQKIAAFEQGGK